MGSTMSKDDPKENTSAASGIVPAMCSYGSTNLSVLPDLEQPDDKSDSKNEPTCLICYDTLVPKNSSTSQKQESNDKAKEEIVVEHCGHTFCRDCLMRSISFNLDAKALPAPCPMQYCKTSMSTDTVQAILVPGINDDDCSSTTSAKLLKRYLHEENLQKDAALVGCIRCKRVFSINLSEDDLVCDHCSHSFCRLHGDAHPGIPCASYRNKRDQRQIRKTEQVLAQMTRLCPTCGIPLQKANGCDNITCARCKSKIKWSACRAPKQTKTNRCCSDPGLLFLRFIFSLLLLISFSIGLAVQIIWLPVAAVLVGLGCIFSCATFLCRGVDGMGWILEIWFFPLLCFLFMKEVPFQDWFPTMDGFLSTEIGGSCGLGLLILCFILWSPIGTVSAIFGGGVAIVFRRPLDVEYVKMLMWELLSFPVCVGEFENLALSLADPFKDESANVSVGEIPFMKV